LGQITKRGLYLMSDIGSSLTDIPSHPSQGTLMIITIQQLILSLATMVPRFPTLIYLQTSLFKHHIQSLRILFLLRRARHRRRNRNQRGVDTGRSPGRGGRGTDDGGRDFEVVVFVYGFGGAVLMALAGHSEMGAFWRRGRKGSEREIGEREKGGS
jgi:hypothetical protein